MTDMIKDVQEFITKFGFDSEPMTLKKLDFRVELAEEEHEETLVAFDLKDSEEFVDGNIDTIVIAIGNLILAGVDVEKAWKEVQRANMSKARGVKDNRPHSGGFDVVKPEGWVGPDHSENHGQLELIFNDKVGE